MLNVHNYYYYERIRVVYNEGIVAESEEEGSIPSYNKQTNIIHKSTRTAEILPRALESPPPVEPVVLLFLFVPAKCVKTCPPPPSSPKCGIPEIPGVIFHCSSFDRIIDYRKLSIDPLWGISG